MGAVACHSDRTYSAGPSALIQDGNHDNGNPFFFWLAPLVQQQAPTDQFFSKQVRPTVTISNLCTGAIIHTFADSQVQVGDAVFQSNWPTGQDNLDSSCAYRIATAVASRQLGIIDVAVANGGGELRNATTNEPIPLLDDRTLPIAFFIGVGSQCDHADADCGEGTAEPGANTTIVTAHGRAGVFIPAGAVDKPATIIIESADDRPCIAALLEPVFPGNIGPLGNSCYDFHTEPPLADVNAGGKFNTNVTVGICAETGSLDHATRDLLQIFQLHIGADPATRPLTNVRASFLSCDPSYPQLLGSRAGSRTIGARLGSLLRAVTAPFVPRPLHASTTMLLDFGAGGSTDLFSRFTWALPSQLDLGFDKAPDLTSILPGALLNSVYSRVGVTFSRTRPFSLLCPGTGVYANTYGLLGSGLLGFRSGQNNISVCPLGLVSDFSEFGSGAIKATFTIPATEACISAIPTGYHSFFPIPGGAAFLEALDASGNVVTRTQSTSQRVSQRLCVHGVQIAAVRFAGKGSSYAIFDDFRWTRLPVNQ
jgi:hypothetical protein